MCLPCYAILGWFYRQKRIELYGEDVLRLDSLLCLHLEADDFSSSVFACCEGRDGFMRCWFALCCSPVRFAADASAVGFITFWVALVLVSVFSPLIGVFGFVQRLHIREQYGMRKNFIGDCAAWFCCYFLPLIQEGKFVDDAFSQIRHERHSVLESSDQTSSVV